MVNFTLNLHFLFGLFLAGALGLAAVTGQLPDDTHRSTTPVSVRDNPASYRPLYVVRGGSWRTSGSSGGGGGFGFGK